MRRTTMSLNQDTEMSWLRPQSSTSGAESRRVLLTIARRNTYADVTLSELTDSLRSRRT